MRGNNPRTPLQPYQSPHQLYPRSNDEVVTHAFLFTPPPQTEFTMPTEVPHNAHTSSELPSNIEESEPSTPLPTLLIMSSPQPLDQGQTTRGRGDGRRREQGRGYRVACEGPSNISKMQVYDRRPQRKKKVSTNTYFGYYHFGHYYILVVRLFNYQSFNHRVVY